MCESFFATLECELIDRNRYGPHTEAHISTFRFIAGFYNPSRRPSALGYLSPIEYERRHDDLTKTTQAKNRPLKRGDFPSATVPVIWLPILAR